MDLEQSVKDLQAQNVQFQQLIMNLSKGQEELKTILTKKKKKKKKTKKAVGVINLGRRFKGPVKQAKEFEIPANSDNDQEDDTSIKIEVNSNHGSSKHSEGEEEYYFDDEQYQHADDEKYKLLEERMKAMEIQKLPGLNFEELGLVSGVVIPPQIQNSYLC